MFFGRRMDIDRTNGSVERYLSAGGWTLTGSRERRPRHRVVSAGPQSLVRCEIGGMGWEGFGEGL
jgi:hypothetical protein